MYWAGSSCGEVCFSELLKANLDGTDVSVVTPMFQTGISGIAVDPLRGHVYWTQSDPFGESGIVRGDEGGCRLVVSIWRPEKLKVDAIEGKLYWNNTTSVKRANLDGSAMENVFANPDWITGKFALDAVNGKLYVVEHHGSFWSPSRITRVNVDGSDAAVVHNTGARIIDVAIDPAGGKIYWNVKHFPSDDQTVIRRANVDGSNDEDLIALDSGSTALAIDSDAGKLYWYQSDGSSRSIHRSNLDGTDIEFLAQPGSGGVVQLALDPGDDVDIDVIPCSHSAEVPAVGWSGAIVLGLLLLAAGALMLHRRAGQ